MWVFDTIREKAVGELSRLVREPVARIVLARTFHIPGWTEPALLSLAQQDTLAPAELEALGWDAAAKLVRVREAVVFQNACACACNYCSVSHGPVAQGPHAHAHAQPPGSRPGVVSASSLRRSFDFGPKIREVFGTDLY